MCKERHGGCRHGEVLVLVGFTARCVVGQGGQMPELPGGSATGICPGWAPDTGAKMSRKRHRKKKTKTMSKGESGLLDIRKVNCVDQIHTTPYNLCMKSIMNLMSVLL